MDYPSNSNKKREPETKVEPKKIQKVISGDVVRRKKSLGKRFSETFVGGDARSVWGYVALDVLIPAAKDAIADAFSTGIERLLYGENRGSSRRGRPSGANGYVAYNRFGSSSSIRRDEPRTMNRRDRATHNFDDIILSSRVEAEEVIDQMFELISTYEEASVADLYAMLDIKPEYTDQKYGWRDFRGAGVMRTRSGYLLDLPRPEPLD